MSYSPELPDIPADVDREIRIEKMKRELEEISDGKMIYETPEPLPLEMEEAFLEHVLAFERSEFDTDFNRLTNRGVVMPPAAELDDATISTKLAEIVRLLAEMSCFLDSTDHLSDRELYEWLWTDGLRAETASVAELGGAWHTSPIGGGDHEDMAIWLKYYADEEDRKRFQNDFPGESIPDHEPLPFDRDQYLPKEQH